MLPFAVLGTTEIILIVFAVLLLFGARKLPELARSMGASVNEFKKGMSEGTKPDENKSAGQPPGTSVKSGNDKPHNN